MFLYSDLLEVEVRLSELSLMRIKYCHQNMKYNR